MTHNKTFATHLKLSRPTHELSRVSRYTRPIAYSHTKLWLALMVVLGFLGGI